LLLSAFELRDISRANFPIAPSVDRYAYNTVVLAIRIASNATTAFLQGLSVRLP
jgi:hypothetical protein